jgi:hypothetical protein
MATRRTASTTKAAAGAKKPATPTPAGNTKKPATPTPTGSTKKPATSTPTGGTKKPATAMASGGAKKPAPATKSGAAAMPKKPTLSDRAAEAAEKVKTMRLTLETAVMRFADRVGGELDRVQQELAGPKPPSRKVLRRIMNRIDEVKLKPAKGRAKDFVRLEDLAEDLADLVPPGDTV